ncbi:hypothetical protein Tco_0066250 [Tanacetum coccineum]
MLGLLDVNWSLNLTRFHSWISTYIQMIKSRWVAFKLFHCDAIMGQILYQFQGNQRDYFSNDTFRGRFLVSSVVYYEVKSPDILPLRHNFGGVTDKAFKRVNTFEDFRTELVEGKEKRAGVELVQESTKKQKVEDDKKIAETKNLMEIIPDEEEVAIDAIPIIYMLVEKKYPLAQLTLSMMLEKKLMIDYESEMTYQLLKFIIKQLKKYGYLKEIVVRRADNDLYTFKEGDFPRLRINEIKDMLLFVFQNRLTNISGDDVSDFAIALRMFTRSLVIQKRVEDL